MSAPRPWTGSAVRAALGLPPGEGADFTGISTDTRTVAPGALFVALKGERFDGHEYLDEALARGAAGAVVSEAFAAREGHRFPGLLFPVGDTLVALGRLAHHRRRELGARGVRVVGITGSSGKTTAKEMTRGALEGRWRVHATTGNLNNRVGLPLTILAAPDDASVLVLEMGTNEPGEIGALAAIAEPEIGVVTTIGPAHLEKLGSLDGVLREKTALLAGLPAHGWAVVGEEPAALATRARELVARVRVAGWSGAADPDLRPEDLHLREDGTWGFRWRGEPVLLRIPGRHAVLNALLALAVADLLQVPSAVAALGVSSVAPAGMRGERRRMGGLTVLVDCYNANPQSMRSALDSLVESPAPGGRVAVLGSMLELGEGAEAYHRELLDHALHLPLDLVVAVGAFADAARQVGERVTPSGGPALLVADGAAGAAALLAERLSGGETVLLKGSRGVALERVLPVLEEAFGGAENGAAPGGGVR